MFSRDLKFQLLAVVAAKLSSLLHLTTTVSIELKASKAALFLIVGNWQINTSINHHRLSLPLHLKFPIPLYQKKIKNKIKRKKKTWVQQAFSWNLTFAILQKWSYSTSFMKTWNMIASVDPTFFLNNTSKKNHIEIWRIALKENLTAVILDIETDTLEIFNKFIFSWAKSTPCIGWETVPSLLAPSVREQTYKGLRSWPLSGTRQSFVWQHSFCTGNETTGKSGRNSARGRRGLL